jgi:uncharacterized protein (TIGR02453 family)
MTFNGWKPAAVRFFIELEANNTKEWWSANTERYNRDVREPMTALAAEVKSSFGSLSIKRPHRDTRFSVDKSPYKTTIAGGIETAGGMLLGLQLGTDGLSVVAGHFELAPDQLTRFRNAIDTPVTGNQFEKLALKLSSNGYPLRSFSQLKGVPKGYAKDHPRARFLSFKGLHIETRYPPNSMPSTVNEITKTWRDAKPLLDYLHEHAGATGGPSFVRNR